MTSLERELINSIKKGNQKAFELVFKSYYERLCRYANTFLHQKETAEDLVKDIFLKMWEKRENFQITSSLSGYLFKSVHNACLNYTSREKDKNRLISENEINLHHLQFNQPLSYDYPLANLLRQELEEKIMEEIENLPQQCKEIFKLSRLSDFSHKQIANQLGLSQNTVKVQIYRALLKLKDSLKPYLPILILQIFMHL